MREQFDSLVKEMATSFRSLVAIAFDENDIHTINKLIDVYNTYQEEERDGVDYIFDFHNKEDLCTCIKGGLTAEELAELVIMFKNDNSEDYTTNFLFGCNHESPYLLTRSVLITTLALHANEIVDCMLQDPFCYDKDIYYKILTYHVE